MRCLKKRAWLTIMLSKKERFICHGWRPPGATWRHGSRWLFARLEKRRPINADGKPKEGALEAVYLTADFGTALAFAGRPEGRCRIDHKRRILSFEHPEAFVPAREVYVYSVDISRISKESIVRFDPWQAAAVLESLDPTVVERRKAGEVSIYCTILKEPFTARSARKAGLPKRQKLLRQGF